MDDQDIIAQVKAEFGITEYREEYDEDGRLISLNLSDLGITHVPVELGQFSNLQIRSLHNNDLTQLPMEMGHLSNLQVLSLSMPRKEERLPEVPIENDIRRFYQAVWNCRNFANMVLIKTLFYTGIQVSKLMSIRITEVDAERCQIRITQRKGSKDRQVPFPHIFRELLVLHMEQIRTKGGIYLFESVRKHKYTDRGVRKMLARYAADISRSMFPHKWQHFLFTWLKKEDIDDALIQPYSGHATRQSLEIYSKLPLPDAQPSYNQAMERFPIQ